MKKRFLIILLSVFLVLGITGCGKLSEKELINTKWYNGELGENETILRPIIEFKKANIMKRCDENMEKCITYIWKIEDNYICIYYRGDQPVAKYEISNDNKTITNISDERVYSKIN